MYFTLISVLLASLSARTINSQPSALERQPVRLTNDSEPFAAASSDGPAAFREASTTPAALATSAGKANTLEPVSVPLPDPATSPLNRSEADCSVFGTGPLTLCAAVLEPLKGELALGGKPILSARFPEEDIPFTTPISPDRFFQLQQQYPAEDRLARVLHETCAVVGSSGSLLLHRWGKEIDAASAVFRFNGAPAALLPAPLQVHTGTRTTYRVVRPAFNTSLEGTETTVLVPNGPKAVDDAVRAGARKGSRHRPRHSIVTLSPDFMTHVANFTGRAPSLAMLAVMLAGHLCKTVKIYGLGQMERQGAKWHYYDDTMAPIWSQAFAADVDVWLKMEAALNGSLSIQCAACWSEKPLKLFHKQKIPPDLVQNVTRATQTLSPALRQAALDAAAAASQPSTSVWGAAINSGAIDDMTMQELATYFAGSDLPVPETRVEMVEAIRQDHSKKMGMYLDSKAVYLSQEQRDDLRLHRIKNPETLLKW